MYQALYRKWRPQSFDEVVGQGHITDILKKQVDTGHFSHAYLFTGTRGTGKTSCAKLLARAVNCMRPSGGNPCNECPSCVGIQSGGIMDVVEMDAASNNGVDNVRALREEAVFSPVSVRKRVYIIDEAHMLSASAFNALLKILEEPPEHLMFILATTELHKIPVTILSRCQRYSFKRLHSVVISNKLLEISKEENMRLNAAAAELIARLSEGSMRDALSFLDQCSGINEIEESTVLTALGLSGSEQTEALLKTVAERDTAGALRIFSELWRDGKAADTILNELQTLIRDVLIFAMMRGDELLSGAYSGDILEGFRSKIGSAELLFWLGSIQASLSEMRNSASPKMLAEMCIISLSEPELQASPASLLSRIERLESGAVTISREKISPPAPLAYAKDPENSDAADDIYEESFEKSPLSDEKSTKQSELPAEDAEITQMQSTKDEGDFWQSLQDSLEGKLKIGVYNILSDPAQVEAKLSGDTLSICASGFAKKMLGTPEVSEKIKAEAAHILGRSIVICFEEKRRGRAPEQNALDELMRYKNVTEID